MAGKASSMASARFQVLGMSGCFIANRITHNSPASRHLHPSKLFLHQLVKQWDLQQCDTSPMPLGVPAAWHRAAIRGNGKPNQRLWAQGQQHRPGHTQGPSFRPGPAWLSSFLSAMGCPDCSLSLLIPWEQLQGATEKVCLQMHLA